MLQTFKRSFFSLNSLQLFDVVYREETLLNVIRSVTRNGRSIILTAVLALILVYLFSIIGYIFFKDDFLVTVDDDAGEEEGAYGSYESSSKMILFVKFAYRTNPNDQSHDP